MIPDNTPKYGCLFVCLMVFNATFNNISVISWRYSKRKEKTNKGRQTAHRKLKIEQGESRCKPGINSGVWPV